MTYLVTLIIPVYKTEKYIEACLQSALTQTIAGYNANNAIEIIVINDGSPDSAIEYIQPLLPNHTNIKLLQQTNSGPSVARNQGIKIAQGEYLCFLDSDDLLPPNAIQTLYLLAKKTGSEVVIGQSKSFNQQRSWFIADHTEVSSSAFHQVTFFDQPILTKSTPSWAKLYKSDMVKQNNILFPENINLAEDWIFILQSLCQANHISTTADIVHLYRVRSDPDNLSATQQVCRKTFHDLIQVYQHTKSLPLLPEHRVLARLFIINSLLYRLMRLVKFKPLSEAVEIYPLINQFLTIETRQDEWQTLSEHNRLILNLIYYQQYQAAYHATQYRYNRAWINKERVTLPATVTESYQLAWQKRRFAPLKRFKKRLYSWQKYICWQVQYQLAKTLARFYPKQGAIVLIGERMGNSANDTSYHFFNYCQKNIAEKKNALAIRYIYVIKKESGDRHRLTDKQQCVHYGSIKHFIQFHRASAYVFNDSMRDIFHHWQRIQTHHQQKKKLFLQHGIFALNRAKGYYDRHSMKQRGELPNSFIVSSQFEKTLICNQFDFKESEVTVTGLSRFDTLPMIDQKTSHNKTNYKKNPSGKKDKCILIFFTWREWLEKLTPVQFQQSDYYLKLTELIEQITLYQLNSYPDLKIILCIHHKIAHHIEQLSYTEQIEIISMHNSDIQPYLIQADLMVTDYSSTAFDMLYQHKPVIFYWFDYQAFFATRGGPLIQAAEEIGDTIAYHCQGTMTLIQRIIQHQFSISRQQNSWAKKFFDHHDSNNCRRIEDTLLNLLK